MPDPLIVNSFVALLQPFASCFTAPSFASFVLLMSGWPLNVRRHTVTQTVRAAGAVGIKHISSFHRFFSQGRWVIDEVGLVLLGIIVERLLAPDEAVVAPVDDTLGRHTGKRIAAASMHRDPLLSTAKRPFFHWGHVWVVLAVNVRVFDRTWALPILFRLHRSKKRCAAEKRPYRKTTQLARELVELLAKALPERRIIVLGDAAYTNAALLKKRPRNVTVIGRSRTDAALYEPAPRRRSGQRGRPRVRGRRLPSPAQVAARKHAPFKRVKVTVYGKTVVVRVLIINALWYVAAGSQLVRLVLVRGFPGHERDDVFACTDPSMPASEIIERFSTRWPWEITFHECKDKLGLEDPQNRTERAVEHTAPMALWAYSLVVLWYVTVGQGLRAAQVANLPWYESKPTAAFSDMVATMRRASWAQRISLPCASVALLRKRIKPLVEYASAAA